MINKTKTNLQTKNLKYIKYLKKFKNVKNTNTIINNTSIHKSHINKSSSIPKKSWYEYPFGNIIDYGYHNSDIFMPIIGEKEKLSDAGYFPHNIKEYIWGEEGKNKFNEWTLLCKLTNDKYAFYTAICDNSGYMGFVCQGSMKLYISSKKNVLVELAMDERQRLAYNNFIKNKLSISIAIPKKSWYEYPFGSIIDIHGYYRKCDIFTPIIGEKEKLSDAGNFPHNISKYIWGEEGDNDFIEWILLCKLTNDKYAFYTAWCDYTGFDCQGGMKLYIASSINVLVKMAMNEIQRTKYNTFINTNIKHTKNINKL